MQALPLVSVVTPSYNMRQFLRETIESVLAQDYPNVEYIVMDGGSLDGSVALLKEYEGRLKFCSGPDGGTADAINKGFRLCRGDLFAYLNADDTLFPDAISKVVRQFDKDPDVSVVYGKAHWLDREGRLLRDYPVQPFCPELLAQQCFISQPAAFMRSVSFKDAGMLNSNLVYSFDYDLWIRLAKRCRFEFLPELLANSRMHAGNKTIGQRGNVLRETITMLRTHYNYVPFSWVHAYASYRADGRDQFFEELRPSVSKYVASLFIGLLYNRAHPIRFVKEWARVMSLQGLLRRWRAFGAS